MAAIFKREFKAYFTSPIGYFVLAILFFFAGWFFYAGNLTANSADLTSVYSSLFSIVQYDLSVYDSGTDFDHAAVQR